MNFTLTHEQQLLQDSAARMVRERGGFEQWRQRVAAGEPGDAAGWRMMAELGWLAVPVPERYDGIGGTPRDSMVLLEQLGRGLVREPYISSCVIGAMLLAHAAPAMRDSLLPAMMAGQCRIALAHVEADGGDALDWVATVARPVAGSEGGYCVSGRKQYVPDAVGADWLIIPARVAGAAGERDGVSLLLVPAGAPGLSREAYLTPDSRHAASLVLDQVPVERGRLIGPDGGGLPLLELAVDHAIGAALAEALGAMEAACALTLDYLKTRQQFGVAIGSFQALQHRMVDMTMACEEARSMCYLAADSLLAAPLARMRAISAAKVRVGQLALFVGKQAVQLHGGIGTSDEHQASHLLKRLVMFERSYGNTGFHRQRYVALSGRA